MVSVVFLEVSGLKLISFKFLTLDNFLDYFHGYDRFVFIILLSYLIKCVMNYLEVLSLTFRIIYGLVRNLYSPWNLVIICGILFIDNFLIIKLENMLTLPNESVDLEFD